MLSEQTIPISECSIATHITIVDSGELDCAVENMRLLYRYFFYPLYVLQNNAARN